ncbi:Oxysterol-binding protein-domain-containing protein [Abortiporus biennis]|nr:Oxysterol-binding protein-domain-containing protein [Abortiporus biennis]
MQHNSTRTALQFSLASTAISEPPIVSTVMQGPSILAEGWVLKKRRKRMQGFARRYFVLNQNGLLSYSFEPGQPTRDQIHLNHAAISSAAGRKDIHIDANNATFHIKCLSTEDFNKWMTAFRKFISQDHATLGRRSSVSRTLPRSASVALTRNNALVEELGLTIADLETAVATLAEEDLKRKHSSSSKFKAEKDKFKEHAKEHSGAVLGLFKSKKGANHANHHHSPEPPTDDVHLSDTNSFIASHTPLHRIQLALETLKHQHAALAKSLSGLTPLDTNVTSSRNSPLPSTAEERLVESPSSGYGTIGRSSMRTSRLSNHSDGSVWFDAPEFDGPQEYVLEITESQPGSQLYEGEGNFDDNDEGSSDTDIGSETEEVERQLQRAMSPAPEEYEGLPIVRRTQLPSPPVGDEGSLFTVLKKNVGKDLSQVALPVSFNEPLTLLQRMAEELEYFDLINQAKASTDPVERMCLVAAFAVSSYASSKHRSGRKGFNPLLAETFEDSRMKFIAEKVCHNPVILAYHAEGDDWELYATSSGRTKFWGKSLEIIPEGTTHLKIGDDHYQWKRPSSFMRNLMMGTKYLEHCGKLIIHNTTAGSRCVMEFKESGYWGPSNMVSGTVFSRGGQTEASLEGKWDEQLSQMLDSSHLRVLWRITSFPRNAPEYYGFTSFGTTLNEITPDLEGRLPPTDSRFRPDVRALEEGNLDLAEEEKLRVEEMQRKRRREGVERAPQWFRKVGDEWIYTGGYWEQRTKGWKHIEPLW